jgi:hypothetical protein
LLSLAWIWGERKSTNNKKKESWFPREAIALEWNRTEWNGIEQTTSLWLLRELNC